MTDQIDNWHKLARYDTNMQGELHANLLRNNDITVSLQPLSAMPGMNSGIVLWVQDTELAEAQRILNSIDTEGETTPYELFDESTETALNATVNPAKDNNNGGTL
ncbi:MULTISPECIES: hypothetical protein [Psychrobacter]|uniref:DUF2007 domain-containing protein n=1 Tax=Psychrobacter alimentarius TaxID=261164 RepID=A0ABM6A1H7_9GAMM|nr:MULTISPECIES: hypothetical protein [Psychrobacter]AMT98203.1 hypothetical protein A3K91_2633 [Psychrobacter alimentarius]